jgi:cellulose synthase/poly-beta-1,6-N-acetylglucosamine synthase-like glycosyltransferase
MFLGQTSIITYFLMFLSLYFEVFLLITFFENFGRTKKEEGRKISRYPTVTITVPVYNEEKTVVKTIETLLNLDYPKDKLKIVVVNDGSKDRTWERVQVFKENPQVVLHNKENGGKYTALNYSIQNSTSELIGCLDADSFVEPHALKTIVSYFEDTETMAVTPAVKIHEPDNIIRHIQKNEYNMGVFNKKVFGQLGAINITPGPFSFFRREVFEIIGPFKHAHNTEDMEIAMRMQQHGLKITNAHKACVYTVGPATLKALYKQRLRWVYGYLKNLLDYREMIFKTKYGYLGVFFLPFSILMILGALYYTVTVLYSLGRTIFFTTLQYYTTGFYWHWPNFDWFYLNIDTIFILSLTLILFSFFIITMGSRLSEGKNGFSWHTLYFPFIFPMISLIWLIKAIYNIIAHKKTSWR